MSWEDCSSSALAVIQGVIGAKKACGLDEQEQRLLCVLILQAFLSALSAEQQTAPFIRKVGIVGPTTIESQCIDGMLLEMPAHLAERSFDAQHGDSRVVLFDIALEPIQQYSHVQLESTAADDLSGGGVAMVRLERLANALAESGVRLVLCQRGVHPDVQRLFLARGIASVERLALRNMSAVGPGP